MNITACHFAHMLRPQRVERNEPRSTEGLVVKRTVKQPQLNSAYRRPRISFISAIIKTSRAMPLVVSLLIAPQVDPNVKFAAKWEDEVAVLFKRLGYQFPISKSALQAVGSPHTWPGLLAALAWVVELLNYEERAEASRQSVRVPPPSPPASALLK